MLLDKEYVTYGGHYINVAMLVLCITLGSQQVPWGNGWAVDGFSHFSSLGFVPDGLLKSLAWVYFLWSLSAFSHSSYLPCRGSENLVLESELDSNSVKLLSCGKILFLLSPLDQSIVFLDSRGISQDPISDHKSLVNFQSLHSLHSHHSREFCQVPFHSSHSISFFSSQSISSLSSESKSSLSSQSILFLSSQSISFLSSQSISLFNSSHLSDPSFAFVVPLFTSYPNVRDTSRSWFRLHVPLQCSTSEKKTFRINQASSVHLSI